MTPNEFRLKHCPYSVWTDEMVEAYAAAERERAKQLENDVTFWKGRFQNAINMFTAKEQQVVALQVAFQRLDSKYGKDWTEWQDVRDALSALCSPKHCSVCDDTGMEIVSTKTEAGDYDERVLNHCTVCGRTRLLSVSKSKEKRIVGHHRQSHDGPCPDGCYYETLEPSK